MTISLRENFPNTELFLVCIFLYSVRIRENADQKQLRIWTILAQCVLSRKQKARINNSQSTWIEIVFGLPQSLMLGRLLFDIFLADFLFIVNSMDFGNYVDDSTPYATAHDKIG